VKISNEMVLVDIVINSEYKDLLLIHLAKFKVAHIKIKSEFLTEKAEESQNKLKNKIKDLRLSLNELFNKLDIRDLEFHELRNKNYEKLDFVAKDINELIDYLLEEINFYSNRFTELERYISQAVIALENIINLKISYLFLSKYDFSRKSLIGFDKLRFRLFTTYTKNIQYLESIFDFSEIPNVIQHQQISNERTAFFIIYPNNLESILKEKIGYIHAEEIPILKKYLNIDGINFTRINKEHDYIQDTLEKYENESQRLKSDNLLKFAAINEVINNLEEYNWVENQFEDLRSGQLRLRLFVPLFKKEEIKDYLTKVFKNNILIHTTDIEKQGIIKEAKIEKSKEGENGESKKTLSQEEQKEKEEQEKLLKQEQSVRIREETPTMMVHNRLIRPFETLTRMYGTPSYSEIDPTPFLFISFPLLFGIMFGDIGHGLVLVISGIIGAIVFRKRGGDIYNFCWIIFWCGLWAILGGSLYGEFFGTEEILGYHLQPIPIPIPFVGTITLFNPLKNVLNIFILTLFIGVIHINLGWILQFINYWKQSKKYKSFTESLTKIGFLDGGIALIFLWGFNFNAWLSPDPTIIIPPILLVLIPGLLLVLFKPLGKALGISYMKEESYAALIGEASMETFETVLSVPSNVLSYIRLLALLLAHISLMVAIQAMIALIPSQTLWWVQIIVIIGLILGNMIVILLEGLLVFLNAIRLHFYEFFFKFYQGKGTEYLPFVLEDRFSNLTFNLTSARDLISSEVDKEIQTEKTIQNIAEARNTIKSKFFN